MNKKPDIFLEDLYNRITGDEDARVCKDIPAAACHDQPRNFFAYLWANLLGKVADEIASAKMVIPWLFGILGVPAAFTGFLVPIREAGVLLPQLAVAAAVRHLPIRKGIWILGAIISASYPKPVIFEGSSTGPLPGTTGLRSALPGRQRRTRIGRRSSTGVA